MGQTFRETFGDAPIRKDLMDFFEDVIVERVMLKKSMNLVKIYISYDKMITKDHIYAMEQEMDAQMFAQRGLSVQIVEDFHLSEQYDTSYIVGHYYDSLLMELTSRLQTVHTTAELTTAALREQGLAELFADFYTQRSGGTEPTGTERTILRRAAALAAHADAALEPTPEQIEQLLREAGREAET